MNESRVDFVVLAPLNEEIQALSQELNFTIDDPEVLPDGIKCYHTTITNNDGKNTHVCIVQLDEMGVLGAAVTATKLIMQWQPWCVVSFGIAGGFISEDVQLLDVIVPGVIYYYEPAKETAQQDDSPTALPQGTSKSLPVREPRIKPFITSRQLMVICRRVQQSSEMLLNVRCRIGGPFASGEKKIADIDAPTRKAITSIHSKMLGVEMEAAGIGAAVEGCPEFCKHFLVIKGIADDASRKENIRNRERHQRRQLAAKNAAKCLEMIIKASQPEHHEELLEPIAIDPLRSFAKTFKNTIPDFLIERLEEHQLVRVLNPMNLLPPIYYHWRTLHKHVHWVDFMHLLVLSKLQQEALKLSTHLPVHLLVTDSEPWGNAARSHIEKVVKAIFRGNAQLSWYSKIATHRSKYIEYAQSQGFDEAARRTVQDTYHTLGLKEGNLIDEEWLQYIVWTARDSKRCIVLVWKRHAGIYEQLMCVISHNPLIIFTHSLCLQGTLGKFQEPGKNLVIDPPRYDSILDWLERLPPAPYVRDLAKYLTLGESQSGELSAEKILHDGTDFIKDRPQLTRTLTDPTHDPQFFEAACSILAVMLKWNRDFFEDWG